MISARICLIEPTKLLIKGENERVAIVVHAPWAKACIPVTVLNPATLVALFHYLKDIKSYLKVNFKLTTKDL